MLTYMGPQFLIFSNSSKVRRWITCKSFSLPARIGANSTIPYMQVRKCLHRHLETVSGQSKIQSKSLIICGTDLSCPTFHLWRSSSEKTVTVEECLICYSAEVKWCSLIQAHSFQFSVILCLFWVQ